jgi:hypothetical protein
MVKIVLHCARRMSGCGATASQESLVLARLSAMKFRASSKAAGAGQIIFVNFNSGLTEPQNPAA